MYGISSHCSTKLSADTYRAPTRYQVWPGSFTRGRLPATPQSRRCFMFQGKQSRDVISHSQRGDPATEGHVDSDYASILEFVCQAAWNIPSWTPSTSFIHNEGHGREKIRFSLLQTTTGSYGGATGNTTLMGYTHNRSPVPEKAFISLIHQSQMPDKWQLYPLMCSTPHWKDNISSEGVAPSDFVFQIQQTSKRVDTEICYVRASKAPWETLSKRSLPGRVAFLWSSELLAKALTEHPPFTRELATRFLWLQHVGGATFSHCGLDSITPLMPNQQPSLWSTVFLVTACLWGIKPCMPPLLVLKWCHPVCSLNMAFAFRTQCYPEGPGQSGLSSHSVCHRTMSSGAPGNWKGNPWECFCCLPPLPSVVLCAAFLSSHPQHVGNIRMYKARNTPGGWRQTERWG